MPKKDLNQQAFFILEQATSEDKQEPQKNQAAVELGRLGGLKGGKARAAKLTPEQRKEISQKAIANRWYVPPPRVVSEIDVSVLTNETGLYEGGAVDISMDTSFDRKIPSTVNSPFKVELLFSIYNANGETILKISSTQDFIFEKWTYSKRGNEVIKEAIIMAYKAFLNTLQDLNLNAILMAKIADYFEEALNFVAISSLDKIR